MDQRQRAVQIWQVLISAAHNRQILTYKLLADLIGVGEAGKGAIAMGRYLGVLMSYCESCGLPPITALVVKKESGKPGLGLKTLSQHPDKDRERVFAYQWFKDEPLEPGDLVQHL